jgi:hypothetical protein
MAEIPSVRNGAQARENLRKNSFLNYESPALTAELQAPLHPNLITRCHARSIRKHAIKRCRANYGCSACTGRSILRRSYLMVEDFPQQWRPIVRWLSGARSGNDRRPRSERDERIAEYHPHRDIIDSFGQLRFGRTCFVHINDHRRLRIILERSEPDTKHAWLGH